jgi:hypothetical protein
MLDFPLTTLFYLMECRPRCFEKMAYGRSMFAAQQAAATRLVYDVKN